MFSLVQKHSLEDSMPAMSSHIDRLFEVLLVSAALRVYSSRDHSGVRLTCFHTGVYSIGAAWNTRATSTSFSTTVPAVGTTYTMSASPCSGGPGLQGARSCAPYSALVPVCGPEPTRWRRLLERPRNGEAGAAMVVRACGYAGRSRSCVLARRQFKGLLPGTMVP